MGNEKINGITLIQAGHLSTNPLQKGIIQTIAKESAVLEVLPFIDIQGNSLGYIQETDTGEVGFRDVNETYNHSNPTNVRKAEDLTRLGSTVLVDRFIHTTQNINDVRATATEAKAKAIANEFTRTFFKGDTSIDPLSFDGLDKRVTDKQVLDAQGFQLHTGLLHHLLDKVEGGADIIFMNKRTRRKLTAIFASQSAYVEMSQDAFGRPIQKFADVRIAVVDDIYLEDDSIYAVKFGMDGGIQGIQAGGLQAVDNGLRGVIYETLIEWYVSILDGNPNGFARLKGFDLNA